MSLPTESDVERALHFLAQSDEAHANAYARKEAMKERIKLTRAAVFGRTKAGTVKEREQQAEASPEVEQAISDWQDALAEWMLLTNKRKRADTTIEIYRTDSANRRRT